MMTHPSPPKAVRRLSWTPAEDADAEPLVEREWLVTNGLGGYASSSVSGIPTRRYHGYLISSLPAPFGRYVMLNHLIEELVLATGEVVQLGAHERPGERVAVPAARHLTEFRLDDGLPVWTYLVEGMALEKRVIMPHLQNTVYVQYRLLKAGPDGQDARLRLRPGISFRSHEAPVSHPLDEDHRLITGTETFEITGGRDVPPLRLRLHGRDRSFHVRPRHMVEVLYRTEEIRGYERTGDLWSPGFFESGLSRDKGVVLVASTEPWTAVNALKPKAAFLAEQERRQHLRAHAPEALQHGIGAELLFAADQFLTQPAARISDTARSHALGIEPRTIIAGYHWFTDWGRDTMISLEGLALSTGRHIEAGCILRNFAAHVRDGLIPNLFPDGATEGLYHTADATPWFFHAIDRYVTVTGDRSILEDLLPTLLDIIDHHRKGTHFGIGIDPADGLVRQGAPGYQLTWMDAKVGDWVVTPRRGKAVEINGLWYNALHLAADWLDASGYEADARGCAEDADRLRTSFNERFWYEEGGHLYDVVDGEQGDDPACRPNQLFTFSLRHPVLAQARWEPVLETVRDRLLTPVGLRSLDPGHPEYQGRYSGDLRARDAAYHQGTVWGWLIGSFVDAWLRVHPDATDEALRFLEGPLGHLDDACIGSMSEVFDADPPFHPGGCAAQAWSVAEVLRCWIRLQKAHGQSTETAAPQTQ